MSSDFRDVFERAMGPDEDQYRDAFEETPRAGPTAENDQVSVVPPGFVRTFWIWLFYTVTVLASSVLYGAYAEEQLAAHRQELDDIRLREMRQRSSWFREGVIREEVQEIAVRRELEIQLRDIHPLAGTSNAGRPSLVEAHRQYVLYGQKERRYTDFVGIAPLRDSLDGLVVSWWGHYRAWLPPHGYFSPVPGEELGSPDDEDVVMVECQPIGELDDKLTGMLGPNTLVKFSGRVRAYATKRYQHTIAIPECEIDWDATREQALEEGDAQMAELIDVTISAYAQTSALRPASSRASISYQALFEVLDSAERGPREWPKNGTELLNAFQGMEVQWYGFVGNWNSRRRALSLFPFEKPRMFWRSIWMRAWCSSATEHELLRELPRKEKVHFSGQLDFTKTRQAFITVRSCRVDWERTLPELSAEARVLVRKKMSASKQKQYATNESIH